LRGIPGVVLGGLVTVVVVDVARAPGHFNLALGTPGTAIGAGATLSTTLAGYVSDHFGSGTAFLVLAAIATLGLACIWLLMPETRRDEKTPPHGRDPAAASSH